MRLFDGTWLYKIATNADWIFRKISAAQKCLTLKTGAKPLLDKRIE